MFKDYLRDVAEAVQESCLFDGTEDNAQIYISDKSIIYAGLPVRIGNISYKGHTIAEVYLHAIPKPAIQFFEYPIYVSDSGFEVIDTKGNNLYYMIGYWKHRYVASQPSLSKYPIGSNFKAVYLEYLKHLEKLHKEAYNDEIEESD